MSGEGAGEVGQRGRVAHERNSTWVRVCVVVGLLGGEKVKVKVIRRKLSQKQKYQEKYTLLNKKIQISKDAFGEKKYTPSDI